MHAVQFDAYGPPSVLRSVDLPVPHAAPGEVRIRVAAIGVNPADAKWRQGMFETLVPISLPHVPGYDIAGTVDALGEGVAGFAIGDRVFAMLGATAQGAYAEYAVIRAVDLAAVPAGMDYATAAALPTPASTGIQMIDEQIAPHPGQTVLVTGATGGVGRFALFACRRRGVRTVAAVRPAHLDTARALGADATIVLGEEDWTGVPFDHVADTVGGAAVAALARHLAPGGRIATAATTPIPAAGLVSEPCFFAVRPDARLLAEIAMLVDAGSVAVPIAHRLALGRAAAAHRMIEAGGTGGKIILQP